MESLKSVVERVSKPLRPELSEKCSGPNCKTCEKHQLGLFDSPDSSQKSAAVQNLDKEDEIAPWAKYLDPERFPQGHEQKSQNVGKQDETGVREAISDHSALSEQPSRDVIVVVEAADSVPKCDLVSMEHPLFALKAGEKQERVYSNKNVTIRVRPGFSGLATIFDKDVWLFCIGLMRHARNNGSVQTGRTVHFKVSDFLKATSRGLDGQTYKNFLKALERLSETRIVTNIETDGYNERQGFGLIESWRVQENKNRRMIGITVTLPECLLQAVEGTNVLTYNRRYFKLRGSLERRLYEIARKHCGSQARWSVSLPLLHAKSGSADKIRKFRASIKRLAENNELPDYRLSFDVKDDRVIFVHVSD